MPKTARASLAIAPLLVTLSVLTVSAMNLFSMDDPSATAPSAVAPRPMETRVKASPIRLDGGIPAARRELNQFIDYISSLDLETGYEALGTSKEIYNRAFFGAFQESYFGSTPMFLRVMADRTTARLFELLSQLPLEEARALSIARFREELARSSAAFDAWLRDLDGKHFSRPCYEHALCVELFLCTQFCEPRMVLQLIDEWEAAFGPLVDEVYSLGQKVLIDVANSHGRPEPLFLVNLYLLMLQKEGALTDEQVAGARRLKMLPLKTIRFFAHDALTTQFDFLYKNRGVPTDGDAVLAEFQAVYTLHNFMLGDREQQNALVDYWRAIVEQHLAQRDQPVVD